MNWFRRKKKAEELKRQYEEGMKEITKGIDDMMNKMQEEISRANPITNIFANDKRLMQLAEYSVSRGFTKMMDLTPDDLYGEFTKFKNTIMKGSITLQELENRVYNQYGITEPPRGQMSPQQFIDLSDIEFADIPEDSPENH